ncbi:hypothetical protein H9P43_003841 [Blastocladiella emersonii ATCC 22665]|nr:hypothetical protein H9P43_003837 [Blastocladiella emersonii ATCC 22665]KAI9182926.1 hypothetical protein H9P43_003841 [Blastocladiella emersonii ATCC 22665]
MSKALIPLAIKNKELCTRVGKNECRFTVLLRSINKIEQRQKAQAGEPDGQARKALIPKLTANADKAKQIRGLMDPLGKQ